MLLSLTPSSCSAIQQVTVNTCNEKTQWLEANPDATTNDFIQQRKDFEDSLAPIWAKLLEPPSKIHVAVVLLAFLVKYIC